jgi:AmiR/NasT family two-component response regulator
MRSVEVEELRVLIAEDEKVIAMGLRAQLKALGHKVVAEAANGRQAVALARELKPDLVVLDIKMPEMDGIEAAQAITAERPIPVILLTAYKEEQLAQRAAQAGIYAYLVKPISKDDLMPAILLARARFEEFQQLNEEISDLKEALEARKLIERAKGILMERRQLTEAEAFRRLQMMSQNQRMKLVDVARSIIIAEKVL